MELNSPAETYVIALLERSLHWEKIGQRYRSKNEARFRDRRLTHHTDRPTHMCFSDDNAENTVSGRPVMLFWSMYLENESWCRRCEIAYHEQEIKRRQ